MGRRCVGCCWEMTLRLTSGTVRLLSLCHAWETTSTWHWTWLNRLEPFWLFHDILQGVSKNPTQVEFENFEISYNPTKFLYHISQKNECKCLRMNGQMNGHACPMFVRVRGFRTCPCPNPCPCLKSWLCRSPCPSPRPKLKTSHVRVRTRVQIWNFELVRVRIRVHVRTHVWTYARVRVTLCIFNSNNFTYKVFLGILLQKNFQHFTYQNEMK